MQIQENVILTSYNTLRLDVKARYFVEVQSREELWDILSDPTFKDVKLLFLGGGSNVLFTGDFEGLVIHMAIKGITIEEDIEEYLLVDAQAGEVWHELVTWAVEKNLGGIENLALIPGTVGAAPVQNIGAYGQSLVDSVDSVEVMELKSGKTYWLTKSECEFGYRDSVFKHRLSGKVVIMAVRFKLLKNPELNTSYYSQWTKYESIEKELQTIASLPYSVKDVYQAVINIRTRQLLDPKQVPTAGSFFKNPLVTKDVVENFVKIIPELQVYPADQLTYKQMTDQDFDESEYVKLPAGRLLDHLGWKGKQVGNVMTAPNHALLITHNGHATGPELIAYVESMQEDMKERLGLDLEMEVVRV